MDLLKVQKICYLYRKAKMQQKEKSLLQSTLREHPDWEWGTQRLQEIDPDFLITNQYTLLIEPDKKTKNKEEILELSYQYQNEWRFMREKRLIEYSLRLFPKWDYLHKRKEWHSRPIFHRNFEESKTQPRKPLHLPRNTKYIPNQKSIESMCFVTGADSNAPYFDLCVQLIESIKATRWYKNVPIKVLDCGLTIEDANYLRRRFGCEIKDPKWDVDPGMIQRNTTNLHWSYNGWKGIIARPYIHKHFPGYQYYFWVDADLWVQNELGLDRLLHLCEKQGIGIAAERLFYWKKNACKSFENSIPEEYANFLDKKMLLHGGIYCISLEHSKKYASYCDKAIQEKKQYNWGFDMAMINYYFYKEINKFFLTDATNCFTLPHFEGFKIDQDKNLLSPEGKIIGIMCLPGHAKKFPYIFLFSSEQKVDYSPTEQHPLATYEEESHLFCQDHKEALKGSIFYRTYLSPEEVYGPLKRNFEETKNNI